MKRSSTVLHQWSKNFRKSPLVNKATGEFDRNIALQLFHGKSSDSYPEDYPHGFDHFYQTLSLIGEPEASETLLKYLRFIGITLRTEALHAYISLPNANKKNLFKKALFLLKAWHMLRT